MLEPFLVNPPRRRRKKNPGRLLAFGLNPRRKRRAKKLSPILTDVGESVYRAAFKRRKKRRNPLTRVHFPSHTETLFRASSSGKWGRKRKKRRAVPAHKGVTSMRHRRKRKKNPVILGANPRRRRRVSARRRRSFRRRNPIPLGLNPRRRRSFRRRSNPFLPSVSKLGLPPVKEMAWLAGGAVAARALVPRAMTALPILTKNPIVRGLSRLGIVAAAALLAKKALGQNARAFVYGALANQLPESLNDFLSLAGIKLSDGNAELELYTLSQGEAVEEMEYQPGMGLYTLSDGESEESEAGALSLG